MKRTIILASALFLLIAGGLRAEEKVFCDFESNDYGAWTVEGEAFGPGPAAGTLPNQMDVTGYEGEKLVNSFYGQDKTTGKLTSPKFTIESTYISFLLGGGGHDGTHIDLIIDGEVVRIARGPNTVGLGSEELGWFSWEVSDLIGKEAFIQIVDEETEGWGHINIDQIVFGEEKRVTESASRVLTVEKKYLWLPVKFGAPTTWFDVEVDGKKVREFQIELATDPNNVAFHATLDVSEWKGQEIKLVAEAYRGADVDSSFLDLIETSDELPDADTAYREKYRPQFHFSPRRGWTNDPNGLMYYKGEYHMFYQHNPFGTNWGNMSWGHVVSKDLLHWVDYCDAFLPDWRGSIFSGSGVVDLNNTTGFKTGEEAPLIGVFTQCGDDMRYGQPYTQGIGYSNDCGRTWTKFEGNPVIENITRYNRDPKVVWYEPTKKWVLALYLENQDYALFESSNLKEWTKLCDVKDVGCTECPDFFEAPVDGDENNKKWVFWGGDGKYIIGSFDGKTFTKESEPLNEKWGGNEYAGQTFSNTEPGRIIQIAWNSLCNPHPGMPFNQQYTVPREVSLRSTPDGIRLCVYPVKELETLRGRALKVESKSLDKDLIVKTGDIQYADVEMTIAVGDAEKIDIAAHGRTITLLPKEDAYVVEGTRAPMNVVDGKVELRVLFDRTSIETFVDRGLTQIVACFTPSDEQTFDAFEFKTEGSGATLETFKIWPMASVWNVQ